MLKVGLIGCGFMGATHAACYDAIEETKITAVADVRPEKAAELAKPRGARIFETCEELIENADVDILDICLPTFLHTKFAVAAMKRGINVFIEKPVCLTLEEGKLLLETEKETGVKVQVGLVLRTTNTYEWLKRTADSKKYGDILSAVFTRLSAQPTWGWNNWLHDPKMSASVAFDMHIHDVDYMRYIMGEPKSINAVAVRNASGVIEQIFSSFSFENGAVASTEACWDFPESFPFAEDARIKFEKATAVLSGGKITVYEAGGKTYTADTTNAFKFKTPPTADISALEDYYNELKYFAEKVSADEEIEIASLSESVKSVELALKEIEIAGGAQKK